MPKPTTYTVGQWMTSNPRTIDAGATLAAAHAAMREERIRHLPVVEGSAVVGIISQRDLHLFETIPTVDPEKIEVREAMIDNPMVCDADASLEDAAALMADHKHGAIVVMRGTALIGVFTTIDALHALAALLKERRAKRVVKRAAPAARKKPAPPAARKKPASKRAAKKAAARGAAKKTAKAAGAAGRRKR